MGLMSSPLCMRNALLLWGLAWAFPAVATAQSFSPLAAEYSISGALAGDQTFPSVSISQAGGYIVWQDNAVDGQGLGIAARRLVNNFSASFGSFRVNQQSSGNQEMQEVVLLSNGGAAIGWQGGV